MGANVVLVALKVLVAVTASSSALLADALHSSTNIVTAFVIIISRRLTGKPVDESHPYGHGKVEFLAAAGVSVIVLALAAVLAVEAIKHILFEAPRPPHLSALVVALISIASNEMLFRYLRCAGIRLRSQTIMANAWANRADCFSSGAVLVGVIGARLGIHHLDPIAALVVAAVITKVCVSSIREALAGLMDRSAPPETMEALRQVLTREKQIQEVRQLRARLMGDKIWVDLSVRVPEGRTVAECESIGARLRRSIQASVGDVSQVLVSFEPSES